MKEILDQIASARKAISDGDFPLCKKILEQLDKKVTEMLTLDTATSPIITADPKIVFRIVSKYTKVPVEIIPKKNNTAQVVNARHICKYLLKKYTKMALREIGEMFDAGANAKNGRIGQDHTTVIHSIQTIQNWMATEPHTAALVSLCEKKLIEYCRAVIIDEVKTPEPNEEVQQKGA